MGNYLKTAYNLGAQAARDKFAEMNPGLAQQRKAPTWGLGGAAPGGFKPVAPPAMKPVAPPVPKPVPAPKPAPVPKPAPAPSVPARTKDPTDVAATVARTNGPPI
jgi:hypothetical protein